MWVHILAQSQIHPMILKKIDNKACDIEQKCFRQIVIHIALWGGVKNISLHNMNKQISIVPEKDY